MNNLLFWNDSLFLVVDISYCVECRLYTIVEQKMSRILLVLKHVYCMAVVIRTTDKGFIYTECQQIRIYWVTKYVKVVIRAWMNKRRWHNAWLTERLFLLLNVNKKHFYVKYVDSSSVISVSKYSMFWEVWKHCCPPEGERSIDASGGYHIP